MLNFESERRRVESELVGKIDAKDKKIAKKGNGEKVEESSDDASVALNLHPEDKIYETKGGFVEGRTFGKSDDIKGSSLDAEYGADVLPGHIGHAREAQEKHGWDENRMGLSVEDFSRVDNMREDKESKKESKKRNGSRESDTNAA